jgi:hypothetical protein
MFIHFSMVNWFLSELYNIYEWPDVRHSMFEFHFLQNSPVRYLLLLRNTKDRLVNSKLLR